MTIVPPAGSVQVARRPELRWGTMPTPRPARRSGPARWVVGLALVVAVGVVAATTGFLLRPAQTVQEVRLATVAPTVHSADVVPAQDARGLHLYLVPHPDDELSGWTSLADGSGSYPVMVLLTQGEQTERCTAAELSKQLRVDLGELTPDPDPTAGRGTPACRQARWNSFLVSLGEASRHTPAVDLGEAEETMVTLTGGPARVLRAPGVTVVALDLGDGRLTPQSVRQAVEEVLDLSGTALPDLPLARLTASGYVGPSPDQEPPPQPCPDPVLCPPGERAYAYAHPDHRATAEAARALASRAQDGAFLVTHPYDPAATGAAVGRMGPGAGWAGGRLRAAQPDGLVGAGAGAAPGPGLCATVTVSPAPRCPHPLG
jgi:LmbE family N-acetylglucosaminyl deacetylase